MSSSTPNEPLQDQTTGRNDSLTDDEAAASLATSQAYVQQDRQIDATNIEPNAPDASINSPRSSAYDFGVGNDAGIYRLLLPPSNTNRDRALLLLLLLRRKVHRRNDTPELERSLVHRFRTRILYCARGLRIYSLHTSSLVVSTPQGAITIEHRCVVLYQYQSHAVARGSPSRDDSPTMVLCISSSIDIRCDYLSTRYVLTIQKSFFPVSCTQLSKPPLTVYNTLRAVLYYGRIFRITLECGILASVQLTGHVLEWFLTRYR
jgi:hypothetical protein